MPELIVFDGIQGRVNIPQTIGTGYFNFGVCLLNDKDGAWVRALELKHGKDSEKINTEILEQWLKGSGKLPVTWTTLVKVLKETDNTILASEIEEVKCVRYK